MRKFLLLLLVLFVPLCASAASVQSEMVLFDGSASVPGAWTLVTSVHTNASSGFDPSTITEGCYFTVDFTGTAGQVYLALSEWDAGTWSQADFPASCVTNGDVHTATFTYAQLLEKYGNADFSDVDALNVGSANAEGPTTVQRIVWHGPAPADALAQTEAVTLYKGSVRSRAANTNMAFIFTRHVGGEFDASQINAGSRFYVEHSGTKNGVYLAFSSHSGAKQWVRVNASETVELDNGRFASYFDYDDFAVAWGTNFARLDQLTVFSSTDENVKLHRVAYFAGSGDPVDTTDGRWDRPDTGIAFIGDSICQNAVLSFGDWNTILGRKDCCNYGIGGQVTAECLARIDELASRDYSMVVFLCGINDIGRGCTADEIVANYDGMVKAILAKNPDCRFLLMSVLPTTDAFYKGQQDKIVALNKAYQDYAAASDGAVTYVDTYSSFTAAAGEYAYPELLSDGLHPNAAGYKAIAEVLNKILPAQ